jgi:phosphotriesterase-related protein
MNRTAAQDLTGKVQTVLGAIEPEAMGTTITHEHLLVDERPIYSEPEEPERKATYHAPLTMDVLSRIHYAGHANLENVTMLDEAMAIEEISAYKRAGGDTVVEVTPIGIHRQPEGLARIAAATGLNIVMGSSYYVGAAHPPDMGDREEAEITDEIVTEIREGVGGTGIRPGLIGEVGCSWPLTDNERKVLRASARAQRLTGAPLMIHPGRDEAAPMQAADIVRDVGADLSRTIMCHIDRTIFTHRILGALAATGCIIEYDMFGLEHALYTPNLDVDLPNDGKRIEWIRWLIAEGFGHQVVVSHDIDNRTSLARYGGAGYAHILKNVVPRMRARGMTEDEIGAILVETPRRLFTFTAPQGA